MKKFLLIIGTLLLLTSCNYQKKLQEVAIPKHVTEIKFWNGGGLVYETTDADVKVQRVTQTALLGANTSWIVYTVNSKDGIISIIDSESLCITYR